MEEEKIVKVEDFKKEERKRKIKAKIDAAMAWSKERFYDAKEFYNENKEFLMVIVPIGIGGLKWIQSATKKKDDRDDYKDHYIWDNRTGQWYRLRRKLRVQEQLELDRRRANGESVGEILNSMRVL